MNVDTYINAAQQIRQSLPYRACEQEECGVALARAIITSLPANTSVKDKLHIWTNIYRSFWPVTRPEREPEPLSLTFTVGSISIWSGKWRSEITEPVDLVVYQKRAQDMLFVQQRKRRATVQATKLTACAQDSASPSWFSPLASERDFTSSSSADNRTLISKGLEMQSRLESYFSRHLPFFPSTLYASCMAQLSVHLTMPDHRRYIEIPLFSRDPYMTHEIFRLLWNFFCTQTQTYQKAFVLDDSNGKASSSYLRQTMGNEQVMEELTIKNVELLIESLVDHDVIMMFVLTDQTNLSLNLRAKLNAMNFYSTHIEVESIRYPNSCKVIVMYCAGPSEASLTEQQAFDNFHAVFFPPEIKPPPLPGVLGFKARWEFPTLPKSVLIQWTISQFQHKLRSTNCQLQFLNSDLHVCLEQEPLQHLLDVILMSDHLYQRFKNTIELEHEPRVHSAIFNPLHPTVLAIDGQPFLTVPQPPVDLDTFPVESSSSTQLANLQTHFKINDPQQAQQAVQRFTTNTFRLCSRDQNPQVFAEAFLDDHKKQVQERLDMQVVLPQRGDLQVIYDDNGLVFMQNDQRRFAQFPVSAYARVIAELYQRQQKLEEDVKEIKDEVRAIKAQEHQPKLITDRKRKAEASTSSNPKKPKGHITYVTHPTNGTIRSLRFAYRDSSNVERKKSYSVTALKAKDDPKEFFFEEVVAAGLDREYARSRVDELFQKIVSEGTL